MRFELPSKPPRCISRAARFGVEAGAILAVFAGNAGCRLQEPRAAQPRVTSAMFVPLAVPSPVASHGKLTAKPQAVPPESTKSAATPGDTPFPAKSSGYDPKEPFARDANVNGLSAPRAEPVTPIVLPQQEKGQRRRVVALTFDACWKVTPSNYDARIIAVLRRERVPATLLLGGRWMEQFPKETLELAGDPLFELGNHTYLHPHMTRLPNKIVENELLKTEAVMYRLTGKTSTFYRPPYGEYDDRTVKIAARLGLKTLYWSADSGDPDQKQVTREIIRDVMRHLKPGGVVLMHMNGRGWHTAEALPELIAKMRAQGYSFVRASDL